MLPAQRGGGSAAATAKPATVVRIAALPLYVNLSIASVDGLSNLQNRAPLQLHLSPLLARPLPVPAAPLLLPLLATLAVAVYVFND